MKETFIEDKQPDPWVGEEINNVRGSGEVIYVFSWNPLIE